MFFFARDVSDIGYQPGDEIMGSLLPVVTHMQNYHINAKYMINICKQCHRNKQNEHLHLTYIH